MTGRELKNLEYSLSRNLEISEVFQTQENLIDNERQRKDSELVDLYDSLIQLLRMNIL